MNHAGNAFAFLINALVGLYLIAVLLRVVLQAVRADFYNPICQFLVRVTNPALKPLRRFVPGFMGIDMAGVVLLLAVQTLELLVISWITGPPLQFPGILLLAVAELLRLLAYLYIFSIVIFAVLSWVNPDPANPVVPLLWRITNPVLAPARQLLPSMGGIDISPMLVIILLLFLVRLLLDPLTAMALQVAIG
jgi:YggT family protein